MGSKMNIASKAVARWLLSRESDDGDAIEDFISAIARGVIKKEEDAVRILTGLINKAYLESRNDADGDDIEKLIALHFKLETLETAEKTVVALQEIRRIIDLPPATGPQARIRSWGMETQLRNIADIADSHS